MLLKTNGIQAIMVQEFFANVGFEWSMTVGEKAEQEGALLENGILALMIGGPDKCQTNEKKRY